jgi:hypothetical protein
MEPPSPSFWGLPKNLPPHMGGHSVPPPAPEISRRNGLVSGENGMFNGISWDLNGSNMV